MSKQCSKCKIVKPLTEFHNNKYTKDKKTVYCKQCRLEYGQKYRDKHKNDAALYFRQIKNRQNYLKRKGDPRAKPFTIPLEEFKKIFDNADKCHYCKLPVKDFSKIKDSHISRTDRLSVDCMANEKGYVSDNLVMCCYRCNNTKNNFFSYEDFMEIAKKYITPMWEKQLGRKLL